MTKVVIVELENRKLPSREKILKKIALMIEGACNEDGSWKKGWAPELLQCYVIRGGEGIYKVVHNLNNLKYAVSISLVRTEGNINLQEQAADYFSFNISDTEKKPLDSAFRFAISING